MAARFPGGGHKKRGPVIRTGPRFRMSWINQPWEIAPTGQVSAQVPHSMQAFASIS